MRYFKWIDSKERSIHGIPGFAWMSHQDALNRRADLDDWIIAESKFELYTWTGPEPVDIGLFLQSSLMGRSGKRLTDLELKDARRQIDALPEDVLATSSGESYVQLVLDVATTLGAIFHRRLDGCAEALVLEPARMERV